jgi:hypothetical protein
MRYGLTGLVILAVAGCGGGGASPACNGPEVLSYHQGEVVVMVAGCDEIPMRPATPEDLARLEAPL